MKQNLSTDETTKCESGELACIDAILIDVTDVDLNRGVVLGSDEPICSGTEIHNESSYKVKIQKANRRKQPVFCAD